MPALKKKTPPQEKKRRTSVGSGRRKESLLGRATVNISVPGEMKLKFDEELKIKKPHESRSAIVQALMEAWIAADPESRDRFMKTKKIG